MQKLLYQRLLIAMLQTTGRFLKLKSKILRTSYADTTIASMCPKVSCLLECLINLLLRPTQLRTYLVIAIILLSK